jgi:hypothetical protein
MKIQTDQMTGLTQSTEKSSEATSTSDAFASILAKEVDGSATQETGLAAPVLMSTYGALDIGAQEIEAAQSSASGDESAVMNDMNMLLDQWDDYADQLAGGSGTDSLKTAYGMLESIQSGVRQLKDDLPSNVSAGLGSMVNELEVMATTEKIKFDRGDYI